MKTKLVNRYYCEFCNKAGCSASHMSRHEKRCTKNPKRECGMCKSMRRHQPEMIHLRDALAADEQDFRELYASDDVYDFAFAVLSNNVPIPRLRESAENCPACILSAIRQFGGHFAHDFDFSTESKEAWDAFNVSVRPPD